MNKTKPDNGLLTCPKCDNKSLIEYLQEETETDFPEHSYQCPCGYSSVIFDGAATATGQATKKQNESLKEYRKRTGKAKNKPEKALEAVNRLRDNKKKIEVYLEPDDFQKVKKYAESNNTSIAELTRNFLKNLS